MRRTDKNNSGSIRQKTSLTIILLSGLVIMSISGCFRGQPSDKPPIHLNPDMDVQPKYLPQSQSDFFPDSSTMRTPVPGTVARGQLRTDHEFYDGADESGNPVLKSPLPVNMQNLKRGQERFNIYCSPCHSRVGDGKGIMVKYGYVPPPSFHIDRIRQMPDGQIFHTITNGLRNMPSYKNQIPVADRWAIIDYLRALERSQDASINDIPVEMRDKIK